MSFCLQALLKLHTFSGVLSSCDTEHEHHGGIEDSDAQELSYFIDRLLERLSKVTENLS